jgi:hypothetical protein
MKRLAGLVLASVLALGTLLSMGRAAFATPFSDVPANHWAYQYIQSLAADGIIDGYPDGKFKGDRPLTRYEMAVVIARVIAKLQENEKPYTGPTKQDLDKLQKLIDALKDELDALGVRVTNLEDALDALDKRTKFAQSLSMHGLLLPNVTYRERVDFAQSVVNTTGSTQTPYYSSNYNASTSTPGTSTIAATKTGGVDTFVNAFMATDDSNNPLTQANSGIQIRQDSRFSLGYQISDNLFISLPVHILNFEWGGEYDQQEKVEIDPGVEVNIAKAGAISNLLFKFGEIDNMPSSRTGLAFRAPFGYSAAVAYEQPSQPYQKGVAVSGTIAETNFGSTSFFTSFTRVDDVFINTQNGVTDPSITPFGSAGYLFPIVAPQSGYVQTGAAQALRTDTFNSGTGTLAQAYLTQAAVLGSVYVSYYNGSTYNSAGVLTGGPAQTLPAIVYDQAYNAVVFSTPIPAGSTISVTYRGVTVSNAQTDIQRYMVNARLNQKFKGWNGLEIGLEFNRLFDFDDTQTDGDLTAINDSGVLDQPLVSDTVFGVDFVMPLPFEISGKGSNPVLFGEGASSKYSPDYRNIAAIGDTGGVLGLRLKIAGFDLSGQYQSIGPDFLSGAPFRYYGDAPALFAFYKGTYFPDFYGFGNNLGINQQFDQAFVNAGAANPHTSGNPALTFIYPVFNPLKGNSPTFYSSFTPNTEGPTATFAVPIRIGDITFNTRGQYQRLQEIRPNSLGNMLYGPAYASSVPLYWQNYTLATQFSFPALGQSVSANVSGTAERLVRNDQTAYQYYPFNPLYQGFDPTAFATAQTIGGSPVSFYPNYVNMRRYYVNSTVAIPVTQNVALALYYSTQQYGGSYGTTLGQNISEKKDYYTGTLTYNIPKTTSSIQLQSRIYKYTDYVMPTYDLNQNRQDVFFTVRF